VDSPDADSLYVLVLNSNKRSITIDLQNCKGEEVPTRLIRECDVFLENFAPGTTDKLGLSYEAVSKINPRIIYGTARDMGRAGVVYREIKRRITELVYKPGDKISEARLAEELGISRFTRLHRIKCCPTSC
jgi:hypothetical protein